MHQPQLFENPSVPSTQIIHRGRLDPSSEALLTKYAQARILTDAHPHTIAKDVSQLRSLAHASATMNQRHTLVDIFADVSLVAAVLNTPPSTISRSTAHARLCAAQRFICFMGQMAGRRTTAELEALDRLLPTRSPRGWYSADVDIAGSITRSRRRAPTLEVSDLERIVSFAGSHRSGFCAARDRALVALQCFSGIRAEELAQLHWTDIQHVVVPPGRIALALRVVRGKALIELPVLEPAQHALKDLAGILSRHRATDAGPIFCNSGARMKMLSYRAMREIIHRACAEAGYPNVESADLRAACAYWLRSCRLSDHEIAETLGMAHVKSVDRLLQRHMALEAQRIVRQTLER